MVKMHMVKKILQPQTCIVGSKVLVKATALQKRKKVKYRGKKVNGSWVYHSHITYEYYILSFYVFPEGTNKQSCLLHDTDKV